MSSSCVICAAPLKQWPGYRRTCDNPACGFAYQQHLRAGRATCSECGRPLSPIDQSRGAGTCRDARCQHSFRQGQGTPASERCSVCGLRLPADCVPEGVCRDRDCREVHAWRGHARRANERHEQFVEQTRLATVLRDKLAEQAAISSPQEFFVTVISQFAKPLTVLPHERRRAFREKIESVVRELANRADETWQPIDGAQSSSVNGKLSSLPAEGQRLVGVICAGCRGFCCSGGDTHAYVGADTLSRLLRERPGLRSEELADLYVDRLPEQSFEGSCVFHGETGCALPRDMRSDTCNVHFCAGQHNLQAALAQGAPPRAFVATSNGGEIEAGRFFDGAAGAPSLSEGEPGGG
jgi:hypothetical protein